MQTSEHTKPVHSATFLRQRKFFTVLPVLVLPFVIFLMGYFGFVGNVKAADTTSKQQGFNMELPNAGPAKDSNWNKLRYYEQADRDSMRLRAMLKNDPYRKLELAGLSSGNQGDSVLAPLESKDKMGYHPSTYDPYPKEKQQDHNERRVYQKLAALNQEMEKADQQERQKAKRLEREKIVKPDVAAIHPDVQKLEGMMQAIQQTGGEDTELQELNALLEKVMDVQHPERMEAKLQKQSVEHKRQVFPVQTKQEDMISVLEAKHTWNELMQDKLGDSTAKEVQRLFDRNRFYSLDEERAETSTAPTAIAAVVPDMQTVVNGSALQLRLLQELYINGIAVPKQSAISGTVSLKNNRLQVMISSIRYQQYVFPVNLTVYSKDGMPGLPLDASSLNDAAKQTMTGTMQSMEIGSMDPSIGAQAASAGIQAAKTLLNKKAKLVKMTVPAGYTVLLVDGNTKDQ